MAKEYSPKRQLGETEQANFKAIVDSDRLSAAR